MCGWADIGFSVNGVSEYKILKISENKELKGHAALWFHEKWNIPLEAYAESMEECMQGMSAVPQWYVALDGNRIIGGLGVIENDFHDRKDLTPNVCAVYVEEAYRCQEIAGKMLDHASFYEWYGWEFLCMVQGEGEPEPSRMYIHRS